MLCIKNGIIHNAISKEAFVADIMIEDGKIVKIGAGLNADGAEIIVSQQALAGRRYHILLDLLRGADSGE